MILTYIISNSREEAENLAMDLLQKKLVFGVNILPDTTSMRWQDGKIVNLKRTIVLAKTKAVLYKQIEDEVKEKQTSGSAIVFSMPISQMTQDLFDDIQANTQGHITFDI